MKRTRHTPAAYLAHAIECIDRATQYTASGPDAFLDNGKTRDAVLRNLEILGQCLKDAGIEPLEAAYPDIRWRRIADFRNVLAHEYLGIDDLLVLSIIEHNLPPVRAALYDHLSKIQQ